MAIATAPMPVTERRPAWVAVVESAKHGDEAAFERLYVEFGSMVHGLLLARVDRASADDLTQEVFLRAWQRLANLHDPIAWPAWLATIARNAAVDQLRRAPQPGTLPPEAQLPATRSDDAGIRSEAEQLLQIIRELPHAHAEPLILRLVEGLSGPEIAQRTGLRPAYVRVNLHRGMKLLRARLHGRVNDNEGVGT
ncbi:RNA polymerase sigma factor [Enhygromyxa salina]|uniref:RNA polymerase sigma factor n=1 Tax=Enhygromyxa salina TaxID=215803 RepID=A0A2S9YW16_9BACT|nr:RNA polymerase sigma factor [Enhygromyxa salina]PRQ09242.1 ECF RNA polymerase sigma factor RpoE [Enhygromyxa salina]